MSFLALARYSRTFKVYSLRGKLKCFQICHTRLLNKQQVKANKGPSSISGKEDVPVERIRNIGVMAHIDAGKTTTTERMLYLAGLTKHLGNVDDGNTVTDYMDQERDRGITITAAAITFFWNKHKINLIDTPGHVDFTLEVERSLRVLDGAITVLDASAGVEAQTITVWRQANKYKIPRIIYLNKMDKNGCSLEANITSVVNKLEVLPLVIHLPVGEGKNFQGVIDLITLRKHIWKDNNIDGNNYTVSELDATTEPSLHEEANCYRAKLIENLADINDDVAHCILNDVEYKDIPALTLMNALRKATLEQTGVPLLCGSSFKNKGVQPLMNSIVHFLPNPTDLVYPFVDYYKDSLCGLAFKTVHDKKRGMLTFVRLYSGNLTSGNSVYNINRESNENCAKILQIFADEHKELKQANAGNIVAVTGLQETITGDTLVKSAKAAERAEETFRKSNAGIGDATPVLAGNFSVRMPSEDYFPFFTISNGLDVPEPVFMCSIEAPSLSAAKVLEEALQCLTKEDPSIRVSLDADTGQTIISGMGELHIEIIKDRILKEYGVDVFMGPLFIAYREAITKSAQESHAIDQTMGKTRHRTNMCLSIHPTENNNNKTNKINITMDPLPTSDMDPKRMRKDVLGAIKTGVKSALSRGPNLRCPVLNVEVKLHDFSKTYVTSLPMVSACAAVCTTQALKQAHAVLLQPMMSLQIDTDEDYVDTVLGDLNKRHSNIIKVDANSAKTRTVFANTPLSEMFGYATTLRTLTSGTASFTMQVSHYEQMDEYQQSKAMGNRF